MVLLYGVLSHRADPHEHRGGVCVSTFGSIMRAFCNGLCAAGRTAKDASVDLLS